MVELLDPMDGAGQTVGFDFIETGPDGVVGHGVIRVLRVVGYVHG